MKFKVLSWNIEKFQGEANRLTKIAQHILADDPDIFGIFEVENVDIINLVRNHFQDYNFHLTQGSSNKEILVGVRKGKFDNTIFTQKREFKIYNPFLRPGALLTINHNNNLYNLLFLHTDSGTEAPDFGNRQKMFEKIWSLKKKLNRMATNGNARLIVLGDLNTMGMSYPTRRISDRKVTEEKEIEILAKISNKWDMELLIKDEKDTFNNERYKSNLDHIISATSINLETFGNDENGIPIKVNVRGWNQLNGNSRKSFIRNISDHSSLTINVC